MSELDPRLERHRPALRYDSQEPYRAISAASITDYEDNRLLGEDGSVLATPRGQGPARLSLAYLADYPPGREPDDGDRLDEAPDVLAAARRFQADPDYADRCYGRVKPDGDRTWLQYWLWSYYNPKHLLGFGRHEGDWELVQVGLGPGDEPQVVTISQHTTGEAKDWEDVERMGDHPVVYVAPLSHANYFEPGAHPYVIGVDTPDGGADPVLPRIETFGAWDSWPGRWGNSTGVLARFSRGRLGGRSPASPGRQGQKWEHPAAWHMRARLRTPARTMSRGVRQLGRLTYPRLRRLSARAEDGRLLVDWELDRVPLRGAQRLLVTLHPAEREEEVLLSHAAAIGGRSGTVTIPLPAPLPDEVVVRGSAFNRLRQRSDPLDAPVRGI
jgi:hypothetical protein